MSLKMLVFIQMAMFHDLLMLFLEIQLLLQDLDLDLDLLLELQVLKLASYMAFLRMVGSSNYRSLIHTQDHSPRRDNFPSPNFRDRRHVHQPATVVNDTTKRTAREIVSTFFILLTCCFNIFDLLLFISFFYLIFLRKLSPIYFSLANLIYEAQLDYVFLKLL